MVFLYLRRDLRKRFKIQREYIIYIFCIPLFVALYNLAACSGGVCM